MIILYRVLTYILLPFAALFSLLALVSLLMALGNPAMFLGVFMLAAFVLYYFSSFRFLHKGILQNKVLKPGLRDWIRVNAFVATPFAVLNFMQSATVIGKPSLLSEVVTQMVDMQDKMGLPAQPAGTYDSMLLILIYVMLIFSIILLIHLMLSFRLMKKFEYLFDIPKQ